jgi:hypothetical protein
MDELNVTEAEALAVYPSMAALQAEARAAAPLLPAPPPAPAPTPAAAPVDAAAVGAAMFPTMEPDAAPDVFIPENIAAMRKANADPAEAIYAPSVPDAIQQWMEPAKDRWAESQRKAHAAEFSRMASDLGMDRDDMQTLISRGRAPEVVNMTPEQAKENQGRALAMLHAEFGNQAEQALADARALAGRDPRVARALENSKLGNDPDTVLRFARMARRLRAQGRLKG